MFYVVCLCTKSTVLELQDEGAYLNMVDNVVILCPLLICAGGCRKLGLSNVSMQAKSLYSLSGLIFMRYFMHLIVIKKPLIHSLFSSIRLSSFARTLH